MLWSVFIEAVVPFVEHSPRETVSVAAWGSPVENNFARQLGNSRDLIASVRKEREVLRRQIEDSQWTITRSRELISRVDELLARLGGDMRRPP